MALAPSGRQFELSAGDQRLRRQVDAETLIETDPERQLPPAGRTGEDVIRLEPGRSFASRWGVAVI